MINSYKDLIVWQKAMDLAIAIYNILEKFPSSETYNLTSQMRRSAVSIPSNIAKGRRRCGKNEFRHFLFIAYSSGAELETQIEIVRRLQFSVDLDFKIVDDLLNEVMRLLNKIINTL